MSYLPVKVRAMTVAQLGAVVKAADQACDSFDALLYRADDDNAKLFKADMAKLRSALIRRVTPERGGTRNTEEGA